MRCTRAHHCQSFYLTNYWQIVTKYGNMMSCCNEHSSSMTSHDNISPTILKLISLLIESKKCFPTNVLMPLNEKIKWCKTYDTYSGISREFSTCSNRVLLYSSSQTRLSDCFMFTSFILLLFDCFSSPKITSLFAP